MGPYRLTAEEIGVELTGESPLLYPTALDGFPFGTVVGMGNPHVVFFVDDLRDARLPEFAGRVQAHREVFPESVNVHFAVRGEPTRVRHFERGAGETLACGSGACAVAVALGEGRPGRYVLALPGGEVVVTIDADREVRLAGPAVTVFTGTWSDA